MYTCQYDKYALHPACDEKPDPRTPRRTRLDPGRLAKKLSVSRQAVNAIETGRSAALTLPRLQIAKLFGTLIEDVFLPDGQSWPQSFGT